MTEDLARLVWDTARLLTRTFESRARGLGVTREQWLALATLARHEGTNQVHFAQIMEMDAIGLCRLVDRLEAAGLVRRERDAADRRARRLYLTQAGWARLDRLRPLAQALGADLGAGIGEADLATARAVLGRMMANIARSGLPDEGAGS
ncbi:MarR family winged helix-turn-helix transcriptional regulator [Novosphingobium bradum]|uniref:MarR family winged helix-turn-helix transcriptional regulator n=1 Tax=Novosphingobium bradum TaxID=1737444 RepID=A0ABV7IRS3_9SPHN